MNQIDIKKWVGVRPPLPSPVWEFFPHNPVFFLTASLSVLKLQLLGLFPSKLSSSFDETLDAWYYFNFTNGATQWQHPLDSFFRERVEAARLQVRVLIT